MKYRIYLVDKFGREHANLQQILKWATYDFGYPQLQEWELTVPRFYNRYFIIQQVMQSKVVKALTNEKI